MKKTLSLALSLIMIIASLTALPFTAHALDTSGTCGVNVNYTFDSETGALVISGTGCMNDYDTGSNKSPFFMATKVKTITIEDGVKGIGKYAFALCANVTSINIPESVEQIGEGAFQQCYYLERVYVPEGVQDINDKTFNNCVRLKSVVLPKATSSIGVAAFYGCDQLTDIYFEGSETNWSGIIIQSTDNDVLENPDIYHFNTKSQSCGENATYTVDKAAGTLTISGTGDMDTEGDTPAYCIAYPQFIKTVTIQNGITGIGYSAFSNLYNVTSITLPSSVTSIGVFAFEGCTSLESVNIPSGVTSIFSNTFANCTALKKMVIPEGVKVINIEAFLNCTGLESVTIPDSITRINGSAFYLASDTMTVTSSCNTPDVYEKVIKGTHRKWNKKHAYKTATTKATLTKNGKIETKCTKCGDIKNSTPISRPKTIKLSSTAYTYNNKVKKPSVTVTDAKGKKIPASNYTVKYAKGRKKIGAYTVTVTFKGNYTGTKKLTFKINPKGTKLTSVNGGTKSFTANWKKQTKNTTGYQIQYSTDKNFESGNKTVTVKDNTKTSKKVKNLKAKKVYYVRVRTYKQIGDKKFTSTWSDPIKVKTK